MDGGSGKGGGWRMTGSAYHAMMFYLIDGASAIRVGGPEEGKGAISGMTAGCRISTKSSKTIHTYSRKSRFLNF